MATGRQTCNFCVHPSCLPAGEFCIVPDEAAAGGFRLIIDNNSGT